MDAENIRAGNRMAGHLLRIWFIQTDTKLSAFASRCGFAKGTVANARSGIAARRTYLRIEMSIGKPLVTAIDEFLARRAIMEVEGFDPACVPLRRLEQTAVKLKVRQWGAHRRKSDLIAHIAAALQEKPKETVGKTKTQEADIDLRNPLRT